MKNYRHKIYATLWTVPILHSFIKKKLSDSATIDTIDAFFTSFYITLFDAHLACRYEGIARQLMYIAYTEDLSRLNHEWATFHKFDWPIDPKEFAVFTRYSPDLYQSYGLDPTSGRETFTRLYALYMNADKGVATSFTKFVKTFEESFVTVETQEQLERLAHQEEQVSFEQHKKHIREQTPYVRSTTHY